MYVVCNMLKKREKNANSNFPWWPSFHFCKWNLLIEVDSAAAVLPSSAWAADAKMSILSSVWWRAYIGAARGQALSSVHIGPVWPT